jgi:hypothetical protein
MGRIRHDVKVKYDNQNKPVDILAADNVAMGVVTAKTDPTSGGVELSGVSKSSDYFRQQSKRQTRSFVVKPGGTFAQSGVGDLTRHMTLLLPNEVFALKVRLHNAYGR